MKTKMLFLSAIMLLSFGCANNADDMNGRCKFESPLTDLSRLKEIIDELEAESTAEYKIHTKIYQCTYRDGTGFLLEYCVGCPDAGYSLISCEGEPLCLMWGLLGNPCTEFNVDFENKTLIYEINKPN